MAGGGQLGEHQLGRGGLAGMGGMEDYRSHVTAWYWYEHHENFTLTLPYE